MKLPKTVARSLLSHSQNVACAISANDCIIWKLVIHKVSKNSRVVQCIHRTVTTNVDIQNQKEDGLTYLREVKSARGGESSDDRGGGVFRVNSNSVSIE